MLLPHLSHDLLGGSLPLIVVPDVAPPPPPEPTLPPASIVWSNVQVFTDYVANEGIYVTGPPSTEISPQDGDVLLYFFAGNNPYGELGDVSFSGSYWATLQNWSSSPIIIGYRYLNNSDDNQFDGGLGLTYTFASTVDINKLSVIAVLVRGTIRNFYGQGMGVGGSFEPLQSQEGVFFYENAQSDGDAGVGGTPFTSLDSELAGSGLAQLDADGGLVIGAFFIGKDSGSTLLEFSDLIGATEVERSEQNNGSLLVFYSNAGIAGIVDPIQVTASITASTTAELSNFSMTNRG